MGNFESRQITATETLDHHDGPVNVCALSEDLSVLITGSDDCTLRMYNARSIDETEDMGVMKGHEDYVTCLCVKDDFVLSGSSDGTVRRWDMKTCECEFVYEGHKSKVMRVACFGPYVISTSFDCTARVWDAYVNEEDINELEDMARGNEKKLSEKEKLALQGCYHVLKGHSKPVLPVLYVPFLKRHSMNDPEKTTDRDMIITGSADNTIKAWNRADGRQLHNFHGHTGAIICMAMDDEMQVLFSGSFDTNIRSWNILTGECLRVMHAGYGHTGSVLCLEVHGKLLYSGSADETARCWVWEPGDILKVYKGHKHSVQDIAFHAGILFTACGDGVVRAFDAAKSTLIAQGRDHLDSAADTETSAGNQINFAINSIAVIDEKLFTASHDGTVRVWPLKQFLEDFKNGFKTKNEEEEDDDKSSDDEEHNVERRFSDISRSMDDID